MKTFTFTASASPSKTSITCQTRTSYVEVQEDPSAASFPSTDILIYQPLSTDAAVRYLAGSTYTFTASNGPFAAGQVIGYVSGVSNSTTMAQIERSLN